MVKAYHIGFVIKQKREEKGISQKELCKGICDHSTLSRIERGKHESSVTTLKMLLQRLGLDDEEKKIISSFNLITLKPIIYALNVSEEDIVNGNEYTNRVCEYAKNEGSEVVIISAKIESELAELDDDEKMLFLNELGITSSGLDKLIDKTYKLLGLATFFTVGSDEVRAWTFKKGMKAPECAGIIHSDFERGFIKAEVMSYDDLVAAGSELKVREAGRARIEGKEYVMQDGDICHFRFNV